MRDRIRQYIQKKKLPGTEARLIVGLSGGVDSVVLLSLLQELGYSCIAAHCNFQLREEESVRDENFVVQWTSSMAIPLHTIRFDTKKYAAENSISIEMAARELRYQWFEKLRIREKADAIAVAHHRDDSVETVLLNLIRGTGLKGLTGIRPRNGNIIRPLLCLSREEILDYANEKGLDYVTDSSNLQDEYTRNKIRNRIIPMLKDINPSVLDAIERTSENLRESVLIFEKAMEDYRSGILWEGKINLAKLRNTPSPEAILFDILSEYQFNPDVIREVEQALTGIPGKFFYSPVCRLVIDREFMIITSRECPESSEYRINKDDLLIKEPINLRIVYTPYSENFEIIKNPCLVYLDAGKLKYPLVLRRWKAGDRFMPFGMQGYKKLSDYFSDRKFSLVDKENVWILCSGEDICWIVGYRADNRFRLNENTKDVCVINLL